jgi:hypothetical protein
MLLHAAALACACCDEALNAPQPSQQAPRAAAALVHASCRLGHRPQPTAMPTPSQHHMPRTRGTGQTGQPSWACLQHPATRLPLHSPARRARTARSPAAGPPMLPTRTCQASQLPAIVRAHCHTLAGPARTFSDRVRSGSRARPSRSRHTVAATRPLGGAPSAPRSAASRTADGRASPQFLNVQHCALPGLPGSGSRAVPPP